MLLFIKLNKYVHDWHPMGFVHEILINNAKKGFDTACAYEISVCH